jgi:DME family drug/metabolite transporter
MSRGNWLIIAAAICWGTTGTAQALAPASAQPGSIGAVRLLIGGAALLIIALWRGALRRNERWPLWPTLLAAGSMAGYQVLFFSGVERTGVAVGTMAAIGSAPILAGLIAFLARGERPGPRWGIATFLAVLGCGLLITAGRGISVNPVGILLAIGAGAAYALFTVTSKGLLDSKPPEAVMAVTFCLGALILSPILASADLSWLGAPRGLAVAFHLGLVTVALAYSLFARGLALTPVATAATLTLAEPLTAGLLGVTVLQEKLTLPALGGMLLIFAGLALLSISGKKISIVTNDQ